MAFTRYSPPETIISFSAFSGRMGTRLVFQLGPGGRGRVLGSPPEAHPQSAAGGIELRLQGEESWETQSQGYRCSWHQTWPRWAEGVSRRGEAETHH